MPKTFASGYVIPDPPDEPETEAESLARWNRMFSRQTFSSSDEEAAHERLMLTEEPDR